MSYLLRVKDEIQRMVYDHDWGGYQKGVQAEQERIIDLLENLYYTEVDGLITNGDTDKVPSLEEVIALIKGEQK